jgi:uncharacterized cupredoxin-like copper-binding protein
MNRGSIPALAGAGLIALAIAGCGSSDSSSSSTEAQSTEGGATAAKVGNAQSTLNIKETDYKLNPDDATVKSGTVTFNASNDGKVTHSLEIENEEGGSIEEELPQDLSPGQSGKLTLKLPPGKYEMYCPIDGHKDLGMDGELTVK